MLLEQSKVANKALGTAPGLHVVSASIFLLQEDFFPESEASRLAPPFQHNAVLMLVNPKAASSVPPCPLPEWHMAAIQESGVCKD